MAMYKKRDLVGRCRCSSKCFLNKKGQITIFIIMGIILLLALVLVILLKQEVVVFKPEEIIPTEKGKVENFITTCIGEIGNDALFLVGIHSGYLEVPEEIQEDNYQHVKLSPDEVLPYWARGETVRIPPLSQIKEDIDDYMEANLRECLLGKEAFTEQYDILEKSRITANTEIVDAKVLFNVRWDLEVRSKSGELISEVIDHLAESPVKLKRVYETAEAIIRREMQEMKFEDITVDLLSLDQDNVPLMGVDLSCNKKKWSYAEAKETFKDMLRVNLREVKVEGTSYVDFPAELPYYQNHYIWNVDVNYPEVGVNFQYNNNFPFYFEVTPREGNAMKSGMTEGSEMLSAVCLQIWKFTYDISYPVMVEVIDETTGYVFKTAFTVHVKRNRADRSGEVLVPSALQVDFTGSEEYCGKRTVPITVYTSELIENNETGVYWTDPVEGVNLSYTCLKYRCEMGETDYNFANLGHVAAYKTNFPYCTGGILRGEKEGYKEVWERVVANEEKEVELRLIPLFEFPGNKIKVVKHEFGGDSPAQELSAGEIASIRIERDVEEWGPHEAAVVVGPGVDTGVATDNFLQFLKGTDYTYNLEIYVLDEEGMKGGYLGNWTVDWNELSAGQEIVFHVLSKEKFADELDLFDFVANLDEYSLENKALLEPEIK